MTSNLPVSVLSGNAENKPFKMLGVGVLVDPKWMSLSSAIRKGNRIRVLRILNRHR